MTADYLWQHRVYRKRSIYQSQTVTTEEDMIISYKPPPPFLGWQDFRDLFGFEGLPSYGETCFLLFKLPPDSENDRIIVIIIKWHINVPVIKDVR